jgi:hypothetical protein
VLLVAIPNFLCAAEQSSVSLRCFCWQIPKVFADLPTKTTQNDEGLFCRAAKKFGICRQKLLKPPCSAAQGKYFECEQKHCVLFSRVAKI